MGIYKHVFLYLSLFVLFSACGGGKDKENTVARVFDKTLSLKELQQALPLGLSKKDSTAFAKDFTDQWIKKNAVLKRAEGNLTENQKDVSQQLEDYRVSLLIFAYERELIRQKLDTTINPKEIEAYYKQNSANFELRSNIIRLTYIKLPVKTPNVEKAKKWFVSKRPDDLKRLEQFVNLYAVNFLLDDTNWLLLEDVIKEIPMEKYSINEFNENNRFLEFDDKDYHYLVSISGYMVKDSNAPLSFEKDNIRNIILNKRKIKLVEKMQLDALNDATNDNNIERFDLSK